MPWLSVSMDRVVEPSGRRASSKFSSSRACLDFSASDVSRSAIEPPPGAVGSLPMVLVQLGQRDMDADREAMAQHALC